jgi:hypothetical protein
MALCAAAMARAEVVDRRRFLKAAAVVAIGAVCGTALASCSSSSAKADIWQELGRHLNGQLLRPDDPRYLSVARRYNARYANVVPQGIALCQGS